MIKAATVDFIFLPRKADMPLRGLLSVLSPGYGRSYLTPFLQSANPGPRASIQEDKTGEYCFL